MSLAIDVDNVARVLLADGWHDVADRSFELDSYEFFRAPDEEMTRLRGGIEPLIPATGFMFEELFTIGWGGKSGRRVIAGPLTSILAVDRYL